MSPGSVCNKPTVITAEERRVGTRLKKVVGERKVKTIFNLYNELPKTEEIFNSIFF